MQVTLTHITEDDIKALYPLGNDKAVSWMSGGGLTYPLTYDKFRTKRTIALSTAIGQQETYVIKWNDIVVGSIGYFIREKNSPLEIGYWLGVKYWGKGIATRALMLALEKMKQSGISGELRATTMKDNLGSRHILVKCGFSAKCETRFESPARNMLVEAVNYIIFL